MLNMEIIGRVEEIEKKIREEISYQALNFDLDTDEIIYNTNRYIELLNRLNKFTLDRVVIVNLNSDRLGYDIKLLKEDKGE